MGVLPHDLTLRKLCGGLGLSLSTLFASYELHGVGEAEQELADAIRALDDTRRRLALELVRAVAQHG